MQPTGAEPFELPLIVRLDTLIEKEYFRAGGISLQYADSVPLKNPLAVETPGALCTTRHLCRRRWFVILLDTPYKRAYQSPQEYHSAQKD